MAVRGKFIAFEGIDGSGKRTQLELLSRALRKRRLEHARASFPHYDGFFGRMVARYLNGEFGGLEQVDAHFSALLYAADRLENKAELEKALSQGKIVLSDRYIGSNLAHQTARVQARKQSEFQQWLMELEYGVFGLPREDLVIYLRVPAEKAQRLVGKKGARAYTRRRRDLQEANLAHLKAAARIYDRLSKRKNWSVVECVGKNGRALLSPKIIHRKVMALVDSRGMSKRGRG
ncbi:MAG TPA: dTMP kinase [Candidatus Acidoferrales bacterium]|nr:dTMP kinase [Candidatus Acidoferrales bacterium]